jgi:hypothetical protein
MKTRNKEKKQQSHKSLPKKTIKSNLGMKNKNMKLQISNSTKIKKEQSHKSLPKKTIKSSLDMKNRNEIGKFSDLSIYYFLL